MTAPQPDIDLANLPRFLDHLGRPERDADAAAFARLLLDEGCQVEVFWGPLQMDVWQLTVSRGRRWATFRVERGFAEAVRVGAPAEPDEASIPLRLAVLGWARSTRVDFSFDDPDTMRGDLLAYGIPALDWLDAGNDEALARIWAAWRRYRHSDFREARRDPERMRRMKTEGLRMIEEAASPR